MDLVEWDTSLKKNCFQPPQGTLKSPLSRSPRVWCIIVTATISGEYLKIERLPEDKLAQSVYDIKLQKNGVFLFGLLQVFKCYWFLTEKTGAKRVSMATTLWCHLVSFNL